MTCSTEQNQIEHNGRTWIIVTFYETAIYISHLDL